MSPKNVVVIGAAGNIGRAACSGLLAAGHSVRGLDVVDCPPPGIHDFHVVDVCDRTALSGLLNGADVVIQLTWGGLEGTPGKILQGPSFQGIWNICEEAAESGVARLILTSTGQVVENSEEQNHIVSADAPYAPSSYYGLSKIFLESLGHLYASTHDMSVLILRPGWMPGDLTDMKSIGTSLRRRNMYLSFNDAARFFVCAVESEKLPSPGVELVYVQSLGEKLDGGFDREPAKRLLGYEGRDVWPNGYPGLSEEG